MYNLLQYVDKEVFGNEAGEEEDREVLNAYFIRLEGLDKFWDADTRLAIVKARKGLGKSTLLSKLKYDKEENDPDAIVVKLYGSEIMPAFDPDCLSPPALINQWQLSICRQIVNHIGKSIGFALHDTTMSMVEASELAGFRGRNIIGSLLDGVFASRLGQYNLKDIIRHEDREGLLLDRYNIDHTVRWIVNPIYHKRLNLRNQTSLSAPEEWREEFFHPPYKKDYNLLVGERVEVKIGAIVFRLAVDRVGYKDRLPAVRMSIKEVGREEVSPRFDIIQEGRRRVRKARGIIYNFEVSRVVNEENLIELRVYNDVSTP